MSKHDNSRSIKISRLFNDHGLQVCQVDNSISFPYKELVDTSTKLP